MLMQQFTWPLLGAVVAGGGGPPVSGDVANPGFEAGAMTGWTQDSGGPASAITTTGGGLPGPRTGTYYCQSGGAVASSTFSQTVDIPSSFYSNIDAGAYAADLTAYHAGSSGNTTDNGSLLLECLDSGGSVLASYTAVNYYGSTTSYYYRSAKIDVPASTRKLRLGTVNSGAGAVLESLWDDFPANVSDILTTTKTLWTNTGGMGNRTGSITVSATNIVTGGGALSDLVDGDLTSNEYYWNGTTGNGTQWLTFDFGSSRTVDAIRWLQSNTTTHGTWRVEGSPDNSSWTQIGSDFTLGGTTRQTPLNNSGGEYYLTNSTAYRYYRLRHMSGASSSSPWLREIEFRIV